MKFLKTYLHDVLLLQSPFFQDDRGSFVKVYNKSSELCSHFKVEQVNYVKTKVPLTLRGLHYQNRGYEEAKLFRVLSGAIQLGFFNIRSDSISYCKSGSVILDKSDICLLLPRGYATGYLTLQPETTVLYLSDNVYFPECEKGVRWNDPVLSIDWQTDQPILSDKDKVWKNFQLKE